MGAICIEPEDRGPVRCRGTSHGELDPIADREILDLAGAPDIACIDFVLNENLSCGIDNANDPFGFDLESLVVGAVFLGLLGH